MDWNGEALHEIAQEKIGRHKFIVVSNREPYLHIHTPRGIVSRQPASGMALALDPVLQACGGTWVAHGSGDADRETVDAHDRVAVPPEDPRYDLRRVWLSRQEEEGYYYGFANEALWPLCHIAYAQPVFRQRDWDAYRAVNEKFAHAVLEEMGQDVGFVFIQDYHFCLLPRLLKEARPDLIVAQFWHIPWPNLEAFRICPWGQEILDGLLGNDLLGFHIRHHCHNFLDTVDRSIEALVDREHSAVTRGGHDTLVRPFPISIDFDRVAALAEAPRTQARVEELRAQYASGGVRVGLGVDRIDYTKGLPERFAALDRFFEKYPEMIGRMTFLQLGPLSRIHIRRYKEYNNQLYDLISEINLKYTVRGWQPVVMLKAQFPPEEVVAYYRLADFCLVSSLHDGMNLVSKEFVAARGDGDGVLMLSPFTGAARELRDALLVNPYATDELAEAIRLALEMPREEKARRLERMRETVRENNIYRWAGKILQELNRQL